MLRALRAYPTLLRIGFAEAVAYRAELLVWMLTTTMPLVSLALWSAVAAAAPVGRFTQQGFAAYFLATLIVRQLTRSSPTAPRTSPPCPSARCSPPRSR